MVHPCSCNTELDVVVVPDFLAAGCSYTEQRGAEQGKLSLQRNQPDTTENERFCFSLIFSASRFITKWHRGAMPPVQVFTRLP